MSKQLPRGKATRYAKTGGKVGFSLPPAIRENGITINITEMGSVFRAVRILQLLPRPYKEFAPLFQFMADNLIHYVYLDDCVLRVMGEETALESLLFFPCVKSLDLEVITRVNQNEKRVIPVTGGHDKSGYREQSDSDYVHGRKHKSQRSAFLVFVEGMQRKFNTGQRKEEGSAAARREEKKAMRWNFIVNHKEESAQWNIAISENPALKEFYWDMVSKFWIEDGKPTPPVTTKDSKGIIPPAHTFTLPPVPPSLPHSFSVPSFDVKAHWGELTNTPLPPLPPKMKWTDCQWDNGRIVGLLTFG